MKRDFLRLLTEFVAIQSVSTDPQYAGEIFRAVAFLEKFLRDAGLSVQIIRGFENPVIVAKTPYDKTLQTILVYGHYDVQPATKVDGQKSNPFILTKNKGRLYARGIADNKGEMFSHVYAVAELLNKKELRYNVVFLIEGNEETGSARLGDVVKKYKKMLASDCILVSDGELGKNNAPALEVSFRGSANFEMTLETAPDDTHSGLFGGVVPNAAEELGKIIGKITEFTGKKNGYRKNSKKYDTRRSLEADVEVTGFSSGYTDVGFRNSIPAKAVAKINVRSTPTQSIKKLVRDIQTFLRKQAPTYTRVTFRNDRSCDGAEFDLKNPFAERALKILKASHNQKPILLTSGGTLPIAKTFEKVLRVPQVMVPLADEDCGAHSASEFTSLTTLQKGLDFSFRFFSKN